MRYSSPDQETRDLLVKVRKARFKDFENLSIELIMDSKIKISKLQGMITLAYVKVAKDIEKYLIRKIGKCDYLIFLNVLVWEMASDKDKKRILSHEMRHIFVEEDKCKLLKHDIEDFVIEVDLNKDDSGWGKALTNKVVRELEKRKEEEKEAFGW